MSPKVCAPCVSCEPLMRLFAAGTAKPMITAMTAATTINSTREKADCRLVFINLELGTGGAHGATGVVQGGPDPGGAAAQAGGGFLVGPAFVIAEQNQFTLACTERSQHF